MNIILLCLQLSFISFIVYYRNFCVCLIYFIAYHDIILFNDYNDTFETKTSKCLKCYISEDIDHKLLNYTHYI